MIFGIPSIFLLRFGPLALQLLRAFPLMWFNLIGFRCAGPKLWGQLGEVAIFIIHMVFGMP